MRRERAGDALWRMLGRFGREQRGATAIEYAVVAAGVAVAVSGVITTLGKNVLNNLYSQLASLF